jgi:hypothetical protein
VQHFVAAALKVRNAGGSWADALQETRKLGYRGAVNYLHLLVGRTDKYPVASIPADMQKRWREQNAARRVLPESTKAQWRAQFDSLVRRGMMEGNNRKNRE